MVKMIWFALLATLFLQMGCVTRKPGKAPHDMSSALHQAATEELRRLSDRGLRQAERSEEEGEGAELRREGRGW